MYVSCALEVCVTACSTAKEDSKVRNENVSPEMKQNWLQKVFKSLKSVGFFVRYFDVPFSDVSLLRPVSGKPETLQSNKQTRKRVGKEEKRKGETTDKISLCHLDQNCKTTVS